MSTVAEILAVLLALVVLALLHRSRLIRRYRRAIAAQYEAYLKGDYEGQLQAAKARERQAPAEHLYFRGRALFQLGRLEEAEGCLMRSSRLEYDSHKIALYKDRLGQVLVEQQRYDEAIACFESGIRDWPERGGCHRGIAAALLRQGGRAAEALGWARRAVQIDEIHKTVAAGVQDLQLDEERAWNLGESLATLAWTEAVNSEDAAEVERLLARAFTLCPETAVPFRAKVHYHAGRAYSALGMTEESASQFERAASLDFKGNCGRLGKAAMP